MKKNMIFMLSVILMTAMFSACEKKAKNSNSEDIVKIGFTGATVGSFLEAVYGGVEEYVLENGGEVINVDGRLDTTYQLGVIEDFIVQGVDAVLYNPVDAGATRPALQMLKDAGVVVINFDTAVKDIEMVNSFIATDNYTAGKLTGEYMVKEHPNGGKIAILDFPVNDAAVQRANGFISAIKDKNFEIVAQLDGGVKPETGMSVTEDILQANPDLTAIFVITDESAQGTYAAIKASGMDVDLYSVNGGPESKEAFKKDGKNGIWRASAAQSPHVIGRKSAEFAYAAIQGEKIEKEVLVPSFVISPDNIAKYGKSDWQ